MTTSSLFAYLAAVAVVIWVPGPNAALVADAGARRGGAGIAAFSVGDLATNVVQMALAAAGLAAAIRAHGGILIALQWAGVAILTMLAVRSWVRPGSASVRPSPRSTGTTLRGLVVRGMFASAVNPTAIMFFAALLPPFVDPTRPLPPQVATMAAGWIVMDGGTLTVYGLFGGKLIRELGQRHPKWTTHHHNAVSLLAAALMLSTRTLN
jgi:threonine/homoserine/homoserine lactone efflux protein